MQESYFKFGEKYMERAERMYPSLKRLTHAWRKVNQLPNPRSLSASELAKIRKLPIDMNRIKQVQALVKKVSNTRAPPLPDSDCIPLRVQDGKILVGKYDNGGTFRIYNVEINEVWKGVAEIVQVEDDLKRAIMSLNDHEFEEYLRIMKE